MKLAMVEGRNGPELAVAPMPDAGLVIVSSASELRGMDAEPPHSVLSLLQRGEREIERVRRLAMDVLGDPDGEINLSWDQASLMCPLPRPGKILCVGRNYWAHAEENIEGWSRRGEDYKMPPWPKAFVKVGSSVVGPGDDIVHPAFSKALDYEVEFAIVIGKEAHYVKPETALDYVAGYTIMNDVTARDEQHREQVYGQHCLGKNFASSAPLGPVVTLKDDITDPHVLDVELRVNGEVRQQANTADLIYGVQQVVSHWSQAKLEPGDVITTGTPSGVAAWRDDWWIVPGDRVDAEVEGIGVLTNHVAAMPQPEGDWDRKAFNPKESNPSG